MKKPLGTLEYFGISVLLLAFAGFFDRRFIPSELAVNVGVGCWAASVMLSAVLYMRDTPLKNNNKLPKKRRKRSAKGDVIGILSIFLIPFISYIAVLEIGSFYTYLSAESKISNYSVSLRLKEELPGRGGAFGFLKCKMYLKAESKYSDVVYAYYCLDREEGVAWSEEMEVCPYVRKSIFGTWISDWNLDSAKRMNNKAFQSDSQIFSNFLGARLAPKNLKKIKCV